jgi:hypothetical protein
MTSGPDRAPPPVPLLEDCILERLLTHLHAFRPRHLVDHRDIVRAWLAGTEQGRELRQYLAGEAGLLDAATERLNVSGDEELREIGGEIGRGADRLRQLAGSPREAS